MRGSNPGNRWLKLIRLVAINVLLLFVFFELASVAAYYLKTKEFFYARNRSRLDALKAQLESELRTNRDGSSPQNRLHPYFGFVMSAGFTGTLDSQPTYPPNNFGFPCPYDFPLRKSSKDQYIIGIFGGSVARRLARYENEKHYLVEALQKSPYFQNKQIVVLCFAIGAYKQPQQLLILNYFLSIGQPLDMVINVDGFNEVAISNLNRQAELHISMPAVFQVKPLVDLANNDLAAPGLRLSLEISELRKQLRDALTKLAACNLATCYTLRRVQSEYLSRRLIARSKALSDLEKSEQRDDSLVYLNRAEAARDESEAYDQMSNLWADSSLLMKEILSARGIQYFQFLQPNQYYQTNRTFSEDEREIAFNEASAFGDAVRTGYPKLLQKISGLENSGVSVFNATNIFDDVKATVYVDNCCHYSELGNKILASYIAQNILKSLDSRPNLISAR